MCTWKGLLMVASSELLISAAQKLLCPRKKRLSPATCLDVTVQIMAVDLGVKLALLYDSNAASPEQLQMYLNALQESGVVTNPLRILSIDGNTFIFNRATIESHLDELLQSKGLILIDVCPSKKQAVLAGFEKKTEDMIKTLSGFFMNELDKGSLVLVLGEELYNDWNLCTLFGILLGYPASYWFDQTKGFGNCLCMTPLVVCTVWVKWHTCDINHRCCLYSFSVPEELWSEVQCHVQQWTERLRERFNRQPVLTDLCFSRETVTLPSVTL
ncbi:UPF0739 protein C1orf74 homolog [Sinocyclocheilus rhinocerous]|uniref:UPF0739 protein C1orf74 homolog n=1 Tax=Sinocyclocheilus rhinocerous TaxID=307959 RepID=A0A673KX10_9TELE|nr:PREDICTED: UPF0739 protein C1orf74 homolog [Sinocyclocheilus rhinocerous]